MAFEGGPLPLIGVGGGPVVTNAINTGVNFGLSSVLGDSISKEVGLDLTAGDNILKSQVTPYLTASLTQSLNKEIDGALEGLGAAAPILSQIAGQATGALGQAILGGIGGGFGGVWEGVSEPTRQWPGAGGNETPANYGGSVFGGGTGGPDVVFSIQPANQGPQLSGSPLSTPGDIEGFSIAETFTSTNVPLFNYTNDIPNLAGKAYSPAFSSKAESMGFDIGSSFTRTETILGDTNGFSI